MEHSSQHLLMASTSPAGPYAAFSWAADGEAAEPAFATRTGDLVLPRTGAKPRNIVIVLTDDHRFDAMGFLGTQDFIETPMLDRMAREGAHFRNAFVTTALCSPSRATIFTGLYAHQHRVVDNNHPIAPGLVFFPEYLQAAGYETAFIGKWHMGLEGDDPQPGFDRWVSFKGQGDYWPNGDGLNADGVRIAQDGYLTDQLNDLAMEWLESRTREKPFMLFLAHKAVHAEFYPAPRHLNRYADARFRYPETMAPGTPGRPMWVENQRNSWHGVDFAYHANLDIGDYYKRYMETFLSVDEGIGRIFAHLEERGELDETLILYMSDNGFLFGEHGLIDKRCAYEESMRIPMLARCPALFGGGRTIDPVVANLDIAPTMLEVAGLEPPAWMEGRSLLPLLQGRDAPWREALLYEYYWERNFPQTPTVHALREDRYKYVRYHGIWDIDELYDLQEDPLESRNLIFSPGHQAIVERMNKALFDRLERTGGLSMPLPRDAGERNILRDAEGPGLAPFPEQLLKWLAR